MTVLAGAASLAGDRWAVVGGSATVAGGVLLLAIAATTVRQAMARMPNWYLTGTSRYIVDDDGVTVEDDMCLRFYRWGFFDRAKQTAGHLLLYVHPVLHVRVPVAALTPEQLHAVRAQLITRDILRPRPSPAAEETGLVR